MSSSLKLSIRVGLIIFLIMCMMMASITIIKNNSKIKELEQMNDTLLTELGQANSKIIELKKEPEDPNYNKEAMEEYYREVGDSDY